MRAKNLALRVLSTAAMLSIVTSIAAPAFAATYYINEGSVDVNVSDAGVVTVNQGNKTYTDTLDSVVIRGGTRSEGEKDDRTEAGASPATQEADGSNAPAGNETEAPKSENTAGDTAPKQETTAAGERKEGTPQQEPTEEKEEEQEEQQEPTEEKVTPELVKTKPEAPKAAQEPSAEQEEEQKEQEEEEEQDEEDEPTVPAAPTAQADNSSTNTSAERTDNVITIVNNFVKKAEQAFSFVLDNVNIDRSEDYYGYGKAALTVKGKGDTEIELDGDNILKGGFNHAGLEKNDSDGTGTLTIKDDNKSADGSKGSLLAKGEYAGAGIGGGHWQDTSHITVTGGKITAVSGAYAAGIGGGDCSDGTDIIIKGDATVIASGDTGAGIGGGGDGSYVGGYGEVTITDQANVTAWSEYGAGIGGGRNAGGDIIISKDATVAAEAYNDSVAIGSGGQLYNSEHLNTNITIRDRANVTAVGSGWHPAIGSRGYVSSSVSHPFTTTINILGGTLNVINRGDDHYTSDVPAIGNQDANYGTNADLVLNINASTGNTVINAYTTGSNAATIGKGYTLKKDDEQIQYNADGRSKFGEDGSVILNLFRNSTTEKTGEKIETDHDCWYDLHKIIGGEQYDTLHNAKWLNQWLKDNGFTSELATDTTHAWKLDKRVEPTPKQEGHVYYKCSVPGCKAVHDEVLPKLEESKPTPEPTPDPTPVQPEPTPEPTPDPTPVQPDIPAVTPPSDNQNTTKPEPVPEQPDTPADTQSTPKLYVIDLASTQVLFDETRQNDTVTYTTKQDGASLTGSFEALEAMAADDVKTIVFQTIGTNTPGAVSRVSVDALLQHGGETLLLTHNGTEVHLTIDGQNADSLLLQ